MGGLARFRGSESRVCHSATPAQPGTNGAGSVAKRGPLTPKRRGRWPVAGGRQRQRCARSKVTAECRILRGGGGSRRMSGVLSRASAIPPLRHAAATNGAGSVAKRGLRAPGVGTAWPVASGRWPAKTGHRAQGTELRHDRGPWTVVSGPPRHLPGGGRCGRAGASRAASSASSEGHPSIEGRAALLAACSRAAESGPDARRPRRTRRSVAGGHMSTRAAEGQRSRRSAIGGASRRGGGARTSSPSATVS